MKPVTMWMSALEFLLSVPVRADCSVPRAMFEFVLGEKKALNDCCPV